MQSYRKLLRVLFYTKLIYYKFKFPNANFGPNIRLNGFPVFSLEGNVIIGKNSVFNSSITSNMVGITKPCTIAVEKDAKLTIGANCGFSGVSIYCKNNIYIGKFCNFGGNVSIWDTDFHPLDYLKRRIHVSGEIKSQPIFIGDDVFVGAHSIILKNVKIGDRSIIGAGSVVTKDIPPDQIWGGNPAKFIRNSNIIDKE